MFLSGEIDIKNQIYTKIHILQFCVKVVVLSRLYSKNIGNQSENYDIPKEPENLRFGPIITIKFLFRILNILN